MAPDKDYYKILGVEKSATADEIKKAFRKKAREHHPDTGGDEEKFKEVNEAHEILGDPEKRAQYDQFGRYMGDMPPGAGAGGWTGSWPGGAPGAGGYQRVDFGDMGDLGDIFGSMFGGGGGFSGFGGSRTAPRQRPVKGDDLQVTLEVSFDEAFSGAEKAVTIANPQTGERETLTIKIPAGAREGTKLKRRGKGGPGSAGGPAGDLNVVIHIRPHDFWSRDGADVVLDLPITLSEAALGADVTIPTPDGRKVKLKIPAGTEEGRILRVRAKGAPKLKGTGSGDLKVRIHISVPTELTDVQRDLLERFAAATPGDPRAHIR